MAPHDGALENATDRLDMFVSVSHAGRRPASPSATAQTPRCQPPLSSAQVDDLDEVLEAAQVIGVARGER